MTETLAGIISVFCSDRVAVTTTSGMNVISSLIGLSVSAKTIPGTRSKSMSVFLNFTAIAKLLSQAGGLLESGHKKTRTEKHRSGDFPFLSSDLASCPGPRRQHGDSSGRSSDLRFVLLTAPSRFRDIVQWRLAVFVLAYSGGPVSEFNGVPY
jgi:hypothetical protein